MKVKSFLAALALASVLCATMWGQSADVLGQHDLSITGNSPVRGGLPSCLFCHAPHSGTGQSGLWSQTLSTATYPLNKSTVANTEAQPTLGSPSNLCLSCHDGTIAPGQAVPYGKVQMSGSMLANDTFNDLSTIHPLNFNLGSNGLQCVTGNMFVCGGVKPLNPAVKLIGGNVQCETCHNPHVQGLDVSGENFLVMDNTGSALCASCHSVTPGTAAMIHVKSTAANFTRGAADTTQVQKTSGTPTPGLKDWTTSAHATASHKVARSANLGDYGTVRKNGCASCHSMHHGTGGASLLAAASTQKTNSSLDAFTQSCANCHNGNVNISPAPANVLAEFTKPGHPFPRDKNLHSAGENAILDNNRHATCVDCHDAHASAQTTSFSNTAIRAAQNDARGVSATDGTTLVTPAVYQYETCLRCHGSSAGKQVVMTLGYAPVREASGGDPLNLIPQMGTLSRSSHPVMHDRASVLQQPSLRSTMLNLDGKTQGRTMGTRLLCTDCHNSDDNRESGGSGPNGPHGSNYAHILERRYEFSQVAIGAAPGSAVQNLLTPVTDPQAGGPYSMCAKCHDLNSVMSDASFRKHSLHLKAGFSCSVCHSSHGVPATGGGLTGERLVNFDLNVVGVNSASNASVTFTRGSGTCNLRCHNYNHNADGTVTFAPAAVAATNK